MPKSDVSPLSLAQFSPRQEALGLMADKKRQKWMREKGRNYFELIISIMISISAEMDRMKLEVEYDQLKHQLSPIHEKNSSSPGKNILSLSSFFLLFL